MKSTINIKNHTKFFLNPLSNTKKSVLSYKSLKEFSPQFNQIFKNYKKHDKVYHPKNTIDTYLSEYRGLLKDKKEIDGMVFNIFNEETQEVKKIGEMMKLNKHINLGLYLKKIKKENEQKYKNIKFDKLLFMKAINKFSNEEKNNEKCFFLNKNLIKKKSFESVSPFTDRGANKKLNLQTISEYNNMNNNSNSNNLHAYKRIKSYKNGFREYCNKLTDDAKLIYRNSRSKIEKELKTCKDYIKTYKFKERAFSLSPIKNKY